MRICINVNIVRLAILLVIIFSDLEAHSQSEGFLSMQVTKINGEKYLLEKLRGNRILITSVSASMLDISFLNYLNELQKQASLKVLLVPSIDFPGKYEVSRLKQTFDSLNFSFLVTEPGFIGKGKDPKQNKLYRWLLDKNQNGHFDSYPEDPDRLYFINEKGVLFSVLPKNAPKGAIQQALTATVD